MTSSSPQPSKGEDDDDKKNDNPDSEDEEEDEEEKNREEDGDTMDEVTGDDFDNETGGVEVKDDGAGLKSPVMDYWERDLIWIESIRLFSLSIEILWCATMVLTGT